MRIYSSNEVRNNFAEIVDISRREPVGVSKHGRIVSIILAKEDFEYYQTIEEEKWMNYKTVPAEDATDEINARIEKLEQKLLNE